MSGHDRKKPKCEIKRRGSAQRGTADREHVDLRETVQFERVRFFSIFFFCVGVCACSVCSCVVSFGGLVARADIRARGAPASRPAAARVGAMIERARALEHSNVRVL